MTDASHSSAKYPRTRKFFAVRLGLNSLRDARSRKLHESLDEEAGEVGGRQLPDRQLTIEPENSKPGPRHENVRGASYYDPPTTLLQ